jgi:hypothetical protein
VFNGDQRKLSLERGECRAAGIVVHKNGKSFSVGIPSTNQVSSKVENVTLNSYHDDKEDSVDGRQELRYEIKSTQVSERIHT